METVAGKFGIEQKAIPASQALAFAMELGAGYNLGNTFDAYDDSITAGDSPRALSTETCWGNPETTREMLEGLAGAGFKTIRIPVSWHNHIVDENCTVSPEWMDRVNTVVDWALDAGLNVILNIHHDNHESAHGFYPDNAHREQSRKYVSRIWEQLAERYRDYDERLIFESLNEPRLVDHGNEWWFPILNPPADVREAVDCINELNQLFVDAVRNVPGTHRTCFLMCPGYDASPDGALVEGFVLPEDAEDVKDRLIVSVHAYTPYDFALKEDGTDRFDPSAHGDIYEIDGFMDRLYERYIMNGIPVVIGEFGARDKNGNLEARTSFTAYYTTDAWAHGIPCVWWDNGAFRGSGELFGIYNRRTCEWTYPEIRDALIENAKR